MSIEQPANGAVLIAGDWHGNTSWAVKVLSAAARTGHDTIIHVGDLKVLWPEDDGPRGPLFDRAVDRMLKKNGQTLIFIDGNHDNHTALRALPVNAGGFGVLTENMLYAPRGHRWTMGGRRFGGLGGAVSIDKARLSYGWDWWPEEEVTAADVGKLGCGRLDVLVTHEVPEGTGVRSNMNVSFLLELQSKASRLLIADAVRNTDPALVFSGHWHQRLTEQIPHRRGTVEVLDREHQPGNTVCLDLDSLTVTPFDPYDAVVGIPATQAGR